MAMCKLAPKVLDGIRKGSWIMSRCYLAKRNFYYQELTKVC